MNDILKNGVLLLTVCMLASLVFICQTTFSNLIWLYHKGMPVSAGIAVMTILSDLIGMNTRGEFPIVVIISAVLLIAFFAARIVLIWIQIEQKYLYALAGAVSILVLLVSIPNFFYGLELIAGARTYLGKFILTCIGYLSGYVFGINLCRSES